MAASAPPPQLAAGWIDSGSATRRNEDAAQQQRELELKMSGISFMSNYNINSAPPGMSASTVSTTSADDGLRYHHDSSIDHSAAGSFKGSTPSSPSPEVIGHLGMETKGLPRPPGLGGHIASPVVTGAGHSKNSSATSPMLTLTPNSSVDGNSDLYSLGGGRQQSPFQGEVGPTMPFLRNDGRRNDDLGDYSGTLSNFGSFDYVENDNDGLLGLDALRDRAYSSPGPMARSFESAPSLRGGLPPPRCDAGSEGRRRRGVSRDNSGRSASSARPPLSGGNSSHSPRAADLATSYAGDLSIGGLVVPFPHGNGTRSGDPSPTRPTQEPDYRGFGAIGRPEFSGNAQEWEPSSNRRRSIAGTESSVISRPEHQYGSEQHHEYEQSRRRSIGTESGREFYHHQQQYHVSYGNQIDGGFGHSEQAQPFLDHMVAHKFGSLPSLGSHVQQKRMPAQQMHRQNQGVHQQAYNPMIIPQPKHQRSYSQPGPNRNLPPTDHIPMEGGGSVGRYPSVGLDNQSEHYVRDPPRYIGAPPPAPHHVRTHSGDSFRSAQSRRSASMSHGSLSNSSYDGVGMPQQKRNSQPNLGLGYYGQALPSMHPSMQRMEKGEMHDSSHHRRHTYEDDLTLLGEHIEVPADHAIDEGYGFGVPDRIRPQMAPPEAMAPHYSGYEGQHIHHHLPTAGAALPSPKVIFNVKFKRTQRSFVLGPRIQRDLKVGTYVKVEADRGEDLGIVIGKVPAEKYSFPGRAPYRYPTTMSGMPDLVPSPTGLSPPGATDLKCIIRLATHDEVSLLAMKREEEEELLKICRTKVRQRGLPMNVVDAEYQFDRHKLTFFFEAEGRIDFRELVRDLFSMYKTRIWMQQLDKNVVPTPGVSPPPTAMMDYGTPIIAPASEFATEFSDKFMMDGLASGH